MTIAFNFKDKKVLVTGASKGIGRAIAESFLEAGANVAVTARGEEELSSFFKANANQSLSVHVSDATQEIQVASAVSKAAEVMGGIDVLVNNVGGAIEFGDFWKLTTQDWKNAFELNVLSMVNFSKYAIPYLRKSENPRIINISSISGVEPGFFNPHYTTTKASTINLSKYLANFLAPENILVNCICPGPVETHSWKKGMKQMSDALGISGEESQTELPNKQKAAIPLGRLGTGEDVASLALFLASEESSWVTGSCFDINGGKMRGMS